ncbi:MAG: hypothetical protein ACRC7C_14805, partial [Beijerinckiaceae bacterium]
IAGAWALGKRFVAVTYGVSLREIDEKYGGLACIGPTNVATLDEFDDYVSELETRIKMTGRLKS